MAEERHLPASELRKRQFRERGEIPRSRDLTMVGTLGIGAICLAISLPYTAASVAHFGRFAWGALDGGVGLWNLFPFALAAGRAMAPTLIGCLIGALCIGMAQNSGEIFWAQLKFDIKRFDVAANLKRIFGSVEGVLNVGISLLKITALAAVSGYLIWELAGDILLGTGGSLGFRLMQAKGALFKVGGAAWVCIAALAAVDFGVQYIKLQRRMRMTHQEQRDEQRQELGDPQVRAQRRAKQKDMARSRSVQDVPQADAVLVNPTHYAVAIRYDAESMPAPRVVAKGADEQAARIRAIARRHGVPVVSRPPLTRLLYRRVKVGHTIPEDLYQAVALVLAYVYRKRTRTA